MRRAPRDFILTRSASPGVSVVSADSALGFARHTHDVFGVGVIDRGAQASASGRGPVEAEAGDVITVNPNEPHDGMPLGGAPRAWRMLYLEPALVADAVGDLTQGRVASAEFTAPVLRRAEVATAFDALHAVALAPAIAARAHWEERLLTLMAELVDGAPAAGSALPAGVAAVRRRIDADPADPADLAALAKQAGLSRFELVRAFARHVGLPPHAYRTQKRIHLARRLILGGARLADAAAAAGFADQSHMTRAFGRSFGLTPAAFTATQAQ